MRKYQTPINDFNYSEPGDMIMLPYYSYAPPFQNHYKHQWMNKKYKKDIKRDPKLPKHHYEILRFSEWASPSKEERLMRRDVVERLKKVITSIHPNSKVKVYGSFESDLCVPQSDIDLSIINTNIEPHMRVSALTALAYEIHKNKICDYAPSVITNTKVPIIKLVDSRSQYMVDINFECEDGLKNTKLIKHFLAHYPLLRPLTIILKYFLKQCRMNDTWSGGISSYTLLILIISFLQMHTPSRGTSREYDENYNLSVILKNFLKFYGYEFDYEHNVISVLNGGCYKTKEEKNWKNEKLLCSLSVEDPQNPSNDIGRASFNIEKARQSFQKGYLLLSSSNIYSPDDSIVARLIFVSKNEIYTRELIKKMYGNRRIIRKEKAKKEVRGVCEFKDVGLGETCNICNNDSDDDEIIEIVENDYPKNSYYNNNEDNDSIPPIHNSKNINNRPNNKYRHYQNKYNRHNNNNHVHKNNYKRDHAKGKRSKPFDLSEQNFPPLSVANSNKKSNNKQKGVSNDK